MKLFDRNVLADVERASTLEWIETDGLGGWASSTAAGMNTRRYHGLLVVARPDGAGRSVVLSRLDETVTLDGEAGQSAASFELGCNRFPGAVAPSGHLLLDSFERGLFPVFEYRLGQARLRKTIASIHGRATTVIVYELADTSAGAFVELLPFVAARDYHSLRRRSDADPAHCSFDEGLLQVAPRGANAPLYLFADGASFEDSPVWWNDFVYDRERERGLDFQEDLWVPGRICVRIEPGKPLAVVMSVRPTVRTDGLRLLEAERARRTALLASGPRLTAAARGDSHGDVVGRPAGSVLAAPLADLVAAADQFLVRRDDTHTVIAGYHWFADWGRDAMIALPGLCLVTGRHDQARAILEAFRGHARGGLLPNRFPDRGEMPEYNTVDATLWYFVAAWKYLQAGGDEAWVLGTLLPTLRSMVAWHERGTRYSIGVAADGLLEAGQPGVQLTWMDAKVGDWVVTPRIGKPVEINALWYNALRILSALEARAGHRDKAERLSVKAEIVRARFDATFWNPARGCLFDVVTAAGADASLRPNQLLALSLPFPLLGGEKAASIVDVVERTLLTPVGLRSLDAGDPAYRPLDRGGVLERDGAYHQGTVWPWLLGPWYTAVARVRGEAGREQATRHLNSFLARHLGEACVGSISEVFDAEEPHLPGGCAAQAWSIAELLRAAAEDLGLIESAAAVRAREEAA